VSMVLYEKGDAVSDNNEIHQQDVDW
jgi:hypothetical protein